MHQMYPRTSPAGKSRLVFLADTLEAVTLNGLIGPRPLIDVHLRSAALSTFLECNPVPGAYFVFMLMLWYTYMGTPAVPTPSGIESFPIHAVLA